MGIELQPLKKKVVTVQIEGTSPLIQHAWSEKAKKQMRMTATERRKQPKTARDPEGEGKAALYLTDNNEYGLPAMALKASIIGAAHKDIGLEKTKVRKAIFVKCKDSNGVLPMECDEPVIQEDVVRVGQGQTDLRYRPYFYRWKVALTMELNAEEMNETDLVNLINRAGFGVGVGEWRPENGGEYGRFQVCENESVDVEG